MDPGHGSQSFPTVSASFSLVNDVLIILSAILFFAAYTAVTAKVIGGGEGNGLA
jgi:hypothetical protein